MTLGIGFAVVVVAAVVVVTGNDHLPISYLALLLRLAQFSFCP